MKKIFKTTILLVIVLLTITNSFAQEGWITDKQTGCKFYTYSNSDKRYAEWTGECSNGYMSGNGTLKVYEDGKLFYTFNGILLNGKSHGQGKTSWSDSTKYEGEFKNGKYNGQGKLTFSNGLKYEGAFKNGEYNGQGKLTLSDSSIYVGEFKDNKFNGYGTYTLPDGSKYEGEFKDGLFNGQGIFTFPNEGKYEGEFKDGFPVKLD